MPNTTKQLVFKVNEEWEKFAAENSWAIFIPEFAKDSKGREFMRRRGSSVAYRIVKEDAQGNQHYRCAKCRGKVLSARVAHSIWDSPLPCSGSGDVHYERVPYCPKCEKKPNSEGIPMQVRGRA